MTVYVVQRQMRYNSETGESEPRFPTITKAERFGEIKYCLSPNEHPFNLDSVLGNLHEALNDYNDDDYIVLVGNPILLGCASSICGFYNEGKINFLQWSARENDYVKIHARLY